MRVRDPKTGKRLTFLTNNFTLAATTIAALYRRRWQAELFFKWIKQYLRIKSFYGTSPNAVRTQVWIGVIVYVLLAIVKKREGLEASYRVLAREAQDRDTQVLMVGRANSVRNWTLT